MNRNSVCSTLHAIAPAKSARKIIYTVALDENDIKQKFTGSAPLVNNCNVSNISSSESISIFILCLVV
jgi:hypothetical protein